MSSTIILSSYTCLSNGYFGLKLGLSIIQDPASKVNITFQSTLGSRFSIVGVSVVIVTAPFDQVLKIYEYDMDIRNRWYSQSYTRPTSYEYYFYIKSMSQKTLS